VFYAADEGTDFTCGPMYELRCRYLEAAPNNWYQVGSDPTRTWSTGANQSISVDGGDDISIGSGYRNSIDIASQNGNNVDNSAAVLARAFRGDQQKTDWYLPSQDELDRLLREKLTVGGFLLDSFYWSSSQFTNADASAISAFLYSWGAYSKSDLRYVRPIRAF
jgi:hypothetical protein